MHATHTARQPTQASHRLVLHALDALMRTSLVQFVEEERQKQRRILAAAAEARQSAEAAEAAEAEAVEPLTSLLAEQSPLSRLSFTPARC